MKEHFLKITDEIEKGKYVQIVPAEETEPVYFTYGRIKPLTDEAVKCLTDNLKNKQTITNEDLFLDKTSRLEFSGSKLPHDVLLENNSLLSVTDNAIIRHAEIRGESEVHLFDQAKIEYLKINERAHLLLGGNIHLHDNPKAFYNGVWNLCHLNIEMGD